MSVRILFTLFITIIASCSSDKIISTEKNEFVGIFRNVVKSSFSDKTEQFNPPIAKKTKKWLSRFPQPIILISSANEKNEATLVALGNNEEKLTWVSSDGISLTFDNGILIATRGYSQDLLSLKYLDPDKMFNLKTQKYNKIHRYLDGGNKYKDIKFECSARKTRPKSARFLEYNLTVDKYIENCVSQKYSYTNEYELLADSKIVIKSKQWISPANQSFFTYNLYAFQKF